MEEEKFWADQLARKVLKERGNKATYVVAAGITPSGTIHIGNFREMITVDLIARGLRSLGKNVRFIYSWDDYDRFRRIPENVPKREELHKFLGFPIVDVPDTYGCHSNYAEHMEREVSDALPKVGIKPEFIHQNRMYRDCVYADEIRTCMLARSKIRDVLNKYRNKDDQLPPQWWPLHVFCEKCKRDEGEVKSYDGQYTIEYECTCGYKGRINFKENGSVKLPWRVDWPMRWHFEKVDCEGGGKDHNAPGGSIDTGHEIIKAVYGEAPPVRFMYDFVIPKGGGKMSKSLGNVIRLVDVLEIYLPEIVRFFFAGTKPVKELSIPMDEEVFKVYEDFYQTERIYFGRTEDQRASHWKRVYEMSMPDAPPKEMPVQPAFKHCAELINIYREPEKALEAVKEPLSEESKRRYLAILTCARNWLNKHAPQDYVFKVNSKAPDMIMMDAQKSAVRELGSKLEAVANEQELIDLFNELAKKNGLTPQEFFSACYLVLISRDKGPRLAPFIFAVGKDKVAKLFKSI
ncbi:MAG: lysine--tRNA ligase [Candidatus Aenigmatarchaeota archaeon]